jgi:hypothetical protein
MTIAAPDFPCLWAEAINMAAYLKNRLPHKYLPSSITPFKRFHCKRPPISHLKLFRRECYGHFREEECLSESKHLPRAREAIIVGYTSALKVYRVFTLEDEYACMTLDLTFPKKDFSSGSDNSLKDVPLPGTVPRIDSPRPRTKGSLYN